MPYAKRRSFFGTVLGALLQPGIGLAAGFGGLGDTFGPSFGAARRPRRPRPRPTASSDLSSALLRWNEVAIDASGLDHTPLAAGEDRVFGEQLGPCRASRAMAIVHIATCNAALTSVRGAGPQLGVKHSASPQAAAATAVLATRAAAAAAGERGLCAGIRGSSATRGRRQLDPDSARTRADDRRDLLGIRRHAQPVRAATALQPDSDYDRGPAAHRRARSGATARVDQRGHGRCWHRHLGLEVLLRFLAPRHWHPRGRSWLRADQRRSAVHAARRSGKQSHGTELHTAVPGLPFRSCGLRRRAVPDAASLLWHRQHRLQFRLG